MSRTVAITPTMRRALAEIDREAGQRADGLPGGSRTVAALMRRGLVEVTGREEQSWRVYMPEHRHQYTRKMHMDSCHWFSSFYECECGVTASATMERSLTDDYAYMWLEEGDMCPRCTEIRDGARPVHSVVIVRPEGLKDDD
jgi:hypothetical protein